MKYSQELIDEVKELYPDYPEMIKHAEAGSVWLGRYLCDSMPDGIPIQVVLSAWSLEELKNKAFLCQRKIDLYKKWCSQDLKIK